MIDYCNPFVKWSYIYNKECALAHSGACGGRLRHLPCTPQCASLAERFCILGKDFPNIQKNGLCNAQSVILVENTRVELVTSCLQGRRSPN